MMAFIARIKEGMDARTFWRQVAKATCAVYDLNGKTRPWIWTHGQREREIPGKILPRLRLVDADPAKRHRLPDLADQR